MTFQKLSDPEVNPLGIAIYVEMRKLIDTRSGRGLLSAMVVAGFVLVVLVIVVATIRQEPMDVSVMLAALTLPAGLGAPIIAVLSVTSDWQHRDVVTFFALQPRRMVLLVGKYVAVSAFSLAVALVVCLAGFGSCVIGSALSSSAMVYGPIPDSIWALLCAAVVGSVAGTALASAILSTPVAIVVVLAQSFVLDPVVALFAGAAAPYVQSGTLSKVLAEGGDALAAASSGVIWVLVPAAIGVWRQTADVA